MRALITRPSEDSTAIAERLEALGIEPVIEPLMTVEPVADVEVDLDGIQAILLTSRNGARAITGATDRRDVPVYAVGDSTAELAREAGFETVESAGGDSEALAMLVRERLQPKDGTLLHAAGAAVAGDLAGVLAGDGFDVRRQELYATKPVAALSVATSGMLSDGGIDLVLFFSPRTAQTFVDLVNQAGLDKASADMTAVCLSRAVARSVGALQWREVQVAERPNMRAMIEVAASAGAEPEPNETQLEEDDDMAEASTPPSAEDRQPWGAVAEPPPAHPRRRWGGGLAAGVVVVAIAAAGVYYWPLLAPRLGQQAGAPAAVAAADRAPPRASDALAGRIASLEAAVKSLRTGALARLEASAGEAASEVTRVAGRLEAAERAIAEAGRDDGAATDARIGAIEMAMGDVRKVLTARLDGLDTRVSGLASGAADGVGGTARLRAENDRLKTTLATLTERMATLEAAAARPPPDTAPARGTALVLAVGQLRDALGRSGPFAETLESLGAVAGDDPVVAGALRVLTPLAPTGVPTEDRLIATFDAAAAAAARAALAPAGSGWLDRTVQRLSGIVTIRREGANVEGDSAHAALARAEARLKARDLAGAEAALTGLTAEPAEAMKAWRGQATSRIAADGALDRLSRHAVGLLAGVR